MWHSSKLAIFEILAEVEGHKLQNFSQLSEEPQRLIGLIMRAMTPPVTQIPHADVIACDNANVTALLPVWQNVRAGACARHLSYVPYECLCSSHDTCTVLPSATLTFVMFSD